VSDRDALTADSTTRCDWAVGAWLVPYHDEEWGVPVHSDRHHFELLSLEAAQAGLSWLSVLKRREAYRTAFAGFDPSEVARFGARRVEALLADSAIIRNRMKITSTVSNARAFLRVQEEVGSFDAYLWSFVGGAPIVNRWTTAAEVPAATELSAALSADLRRRGFRFVGPTIVYSHLQAAGLVMDHLTRCHRFEQLATAGATSGHSAGPDRRRPGRPRR